MKPFNKMSLAELDDLVGSDDDDEATAALEEIDRRLSLLDDHRVAQAMGENPQDKPS